MNYTLEEIKKYKIKINDLSNKLINTLDINEEIMINNEIKKETEFLLSLLNIKKNEIINFNNNNNNRINMNNNYNQQMNNQQFQFFNFHQQMMAQQQAAMKEQMNKILNNGPYNEQHPINLNDLITVKFIIIGQNEKKIGTMVIHCEPNDKLSNIIQRYRNLAIDDNSKNFIFKGKELNDNLIGNLTVAEAGIYNNSEIFVYGGLWK